MKHVRSLLATVRHWVGFVAINAYVLARPASLDEPRRKQC